MKQLGKKIKYIFIGLFIITVLLDSLLVFLGLFEITSEVNTSNEIVYFITNNKLIVTILSLLFVIFYNLLRYGFIIGVYVSIKLGKRKVYHEKLSKIDFQNNNDYFRDIIKNYNPLELSYIDDFKIDYPKDVVAILLSMKQKGIIKFNDKEKVVEVVSSSLPKSSIEEYVLSKIIFGKIRIGDFNVRELKKLACDEAYTNGLLQNDNKKINVKKNVLSIVTVMFVLFMISNFMSSFYINAFFEVIIGIILILFVTIMPYIFIFLIVYIVSYYRQKRINPYIRSEKGEDVNRKLEGLKNYLKDFSYLDERNAEEIIIWEDYLIYSVLFNQNKKIIKDIYDTYF